MRSPAYMIHTDGESRTEKQGPGMILNPGQSDEESRRRITGWSVDGRLHTHTAAKFWIGLIDDALRLYPECDSLTLSAPSIGLYKESMLDPVHSLQRQIESLGKLDIGEEFDNALTEMDLFGPPASVHLELFNQNDLVFGRDLNHESIDAEILPFITVWMLAWGGVPSFRWNHQDVCGHFGAEEGDTGDLYDIIFMTSHEHLSEDLYRHQIRVSYKRQPGSS